MIPVGVGLSALGSLAEEASCSIGKKEMALHVESPFTFGMLNAVWMVAISLFLILFVRHTFLFSLATLPFFCTRMVLEIALAHGTVRAIQIAERTTYGLLRVITIPVLLIADVVIGSGLGWMQILGVIVIILSMIVFFLNHGFARRGVWLVVATSITGAITSLLYRYTLTHGNAVEAESLISGTLIATYFFFQARHHEQKNPFTHLRNRLIVFQSAAFGASSIILGFSFLFAPSSVVMAVKRSAAVIWSMIAGIAVFHERDRVTKTIAATLAVIGVVLLTLK